MAPANSIDSLLDLTNICRLCLSQNAHLHPIFTENKLIESSFGSLDSKIKACVDIEIMPGDNLPGMICYRCVEQLENWVKFKELCDNANTLLLQCAAGGIQSLSDEILQKTSQNSNGCLYLPETSPDFSFVDISLLEQDSLFQKLEDTQQECLPSNRPIVEDSNPTLLEDNPICTRTGQTSVNEKESNIQNEKEAQKEQNKIILRKKYLNIYSKKYKCDLCEIVFTKFSGLLHHDKVDHKNMIPDEMCVICGKLFVTKHRLDMHKNLKHRGKIYECDVCGLKSVSEKSLKVHKVRHSARFVCSVCNFVSSTNRSLQDHLNIHKIESSYSCEVCQRTFKQKQSLEHHLKNHDDDQVLRAKCDVCFKKFKTFNMLRKHKISHNKEIYGDIRSTCMSVCEICGLTFKTNSALYTHKLSHYEKRHMCMVCDKLFYTKNLLRRHMLVHGEHSFACKVCNKSFSRVDTLSLHLNTHIKSQLFSCQQCDRSFSLNRYLKRHIARMH
uniref:Protein krueppel n=1 Tax=Graphocephala atropunctata TaxID=36148 RepID=A0A1B6KBF5_9HEMI